MIPLAVIHRIQPKWLIMLTERTCFFNVCHIAQLYFKNASAELEKSHKMLPVLFLRTTWNYLAVEEKIRNILLLSKAIKSIGSMFGVLHKKQ